MVSTEGLLPNDSLALSSSGGIGNSTNDLMSGSLLTDATLGESNDLTALSRTLKASSSGGGESSAELAELNTSAVPISQTESRLDLGQNLQGFASSPTSSTTKPVEAADADPFSGQALNALAANDSVENLQTSNTLTTKYLSDLDWISATSGWGPVEKDISNGEKQAGDGQKITLNGKSYNKGLGTHSASEIRYALDGNYTNFRSDIGIDDEVGAKGSVNFQVWADNAKLFDSGVMKGDSATKQVEVGLAGKQELKLIVTDGGDKKSYDHADWANARLIESEAESPNQTPMPEAGNGKGLTGQYYDNKDLSDLKLTRTDATVDFKWDKGSPDKSIGSDTFSARWTGQVQPQYSEKYTFHTTSDDGVRLWVNGKKLIDNWTNHAPTENKGTIALTAGQKYDIKMEYYEDTRGAVANLGWSSSSQSKQIIPQSQLFSKSTIQTPDPTPRPKPDPKPDPTPPPLSGLGKPARSADSFIDSIGVATHIQYGGPYGKFDSIIKPRLEELGVRHIRTSGSSEKVIERLNELAESGIKTNLVADPRNGITPSNIVSYLKRMPNAIESVEGPNEWDVHPELKYNGKSFPEGLRDYQEDLFKAINSDPTTKDIIVAAPSMAHSYAGLKELGRMDSFDKGNMHSYAGGQRPTNSLDNKWIPHTQAVSGSKPIFATETGWHNALNDTKGQKGVSEKAEAKYTPRLYLEYFNKPEIERTFRYELINVGKSDNNNRTNWGLLNADGSPQLAFNALKNLIDLTEDPGAKKFTPGKLDYKLSGDLENVHQTLLQKSNGEFNLILWQDAMSYDTKAKKDISVLENKVTLELNQPFESAKSYLPLNSTKAIKSYSSPTSINLSVPDHPLVIQLT